MNRKSGSGSSAPNTAASPPSWVAEQDMTVASQALQKAAQPMLDWLTQVQASQAAALEAYSRALQSTLDAALVAGRPSGVWQAQGELLGAAMAQAARLQREAMASWFAGLPGAAGSEPPELSTSLQQVRTSFDDAMRPWMALMSAVSTGRLPGA